MNIKIKFEAVKNNGKGITFTKVITVPDELIEIDDQDEFISTFDEADIMDNHDLLFIKDFFRYDEVEEALKKEARKLKKQIKNDWKKIGEDYKYLFEEYQILYESSKESVKLYEHLSKKWQNIAIDYRTKLESILGKPVEKTELLVSRIGSLLDGKREISEKTDLY